MISVKCLASGSSGNSYAIDDGDTVLLLEAGMPSKKITTAFNTLLSRVVGCLITHEHLDHARGMGKLADAGIDLYASAGTFEARKADIRRSYRCNTIRAGIQFNLGSWTVLPWEAQHDAAEPLGFLILSRTTGEKLLFATDTYFIPNTFRGLNYLMLECNYDIATLSHNVISGVIPESLKPRLLQSHFSIDNVKDFLRHNDLSGVQRIYLIHISGNNGDREKYKKEIIKFTGCPVTVF